MAHTSSNSAVTPPAVDGLAIIAQPRQAMLFKPLTGIRAIAAIWVILGHFSPKITDLFPGFAALHPVINSGYLGVDLFFVLSGFILAHNYLNEFRSLSLVQYGRFLWVRLARLYPVHIFCLFLLLGGVFAGSAAGLHFNMPERLGLADFLRNLVLIHAWGFASDSSWNGPAWSISAEWFAYLLFPLIALGVVRIRSTVAAVAIAVAMYAILFAAFARMGITQTTLANDLALVRVITQFTAGCLLYRVYTYSWKNAVGWELVAWLAVAAIIIERFIFPPDLIKSLAPAPMLGVLVLALASAGGPMAKFLGTRTMIFWGEVSYSLYMTHDLVRLALNKLLNTDNYIHSSVAVRVGVLLLYAAIIAMAALCTYFIVEKPARRWMRNLIGRGKPVDEAQLPIHAAATHIGASSEPIPAS